MNKEQAILLGIFGIFVVSILVIFKFIRIDLRSDSSKEVSLKIEDIKMGTGDAVKNGDTILINYTGTLKDGTKFDSSYDRGVPFETKIGVGQVIKGWDEGVVGMKVGGERRLTIPPSLGYGSQAVGSIPPDSTLLFDVELVQIK